MKESLRAEALRELGSTRCLCGARKKKGNSFCRDCYFALPQGLRNRLYQTAGYELKWDEARDFLRQQTDRLQPREAKGPLFKGDPAA